MPPQSRIKLLPQPIDTEALFLNTKGLLIANCLQPSCHVRSTITSRKVGRKDSF